MKRLALLIATCATCLAPEASLSQGCPLKVTVAGTNVPFQNGEHIVVWFENQSGKTISRAEFALALIDAANQRRAAKQVYSVDSAVRPFQAGLMMEPAANEARQFSNWKSVRGLDVSIRDVQFADGTRWQSTAGDCRKTFLNANYQHDMRQWNADLRSDWNRRHPDDPMPEPAFAAWLLPHMEGWR